MTSAHYFSTVQVLNPVKIIMWRGWGGGIRMKGRSLNPNPSRSHLLIKFTEVTAAEKRGCRFGNVNEDGAILAVCHQSKNAQAVRASAVNVSGRGLRSIFQNFPPASFET